MRVALLTALLAGFATAVTFAQTYPMQTPVPRTTSAPALRALAVQREIEERFRIGLGAEARADWSAAVPEFQRIIALHPPEPQGSTARYDLAIADAKLQRYDDAARALQAAIALDPGFLAAMANLISVDVARGDLPDARRIADRFVAIAPRSARALYARGIVALQAGDAQTARNDFGKLLNANPGYALAHYDLALAEERLSHYPAAERELRTALSLAPGYARARLALGAVLLREGHRHQARAAFAQAGRDAAGDPALQNLAVAMQNSLPI